MKKTKTSALLIVLCLILTHGTLSAQATKSTWVKLAEKLLYQRKEAASTANTQPPVSRKRTPAGTPTSRKETPTKTDSRERKRTNPSGTEARDRRSPAEKPSRREAPSRRRETENRESENRTDAEARRERRPTSYPAGKRSPRQQRQEGDCYGKRSKAKCGVPGCQHPGKHKGLHKKQDRVRPIYFDH